MDALTNTIRILKNIDLLLTEGLFPGSVGLLVYEAKSLVSKMVIEAEAAAVPVQEATSEQASQGT